MDADSATLTTAVDPAQWLAHSRQQMLADSGFTSTDLHRAVRRNRKLITARKVKHIVVAGEIHEREMDDHEAQLRAIDMIYDLAGVKAPRAQSSIASAGVEVVIDAQSGQVIVRAVTT